MKLVGCSIEYLKSHLEKQFTEGMNWSNYGKWHVDHKKPLSKGGTTIMSNLKAKPAAANRSFKRKPDGSMK
jgi:hypothetical protein